MSKWEYTIEVSDLYDSYISEECSLADFVAALKNRIEEIVPEEICAEIEDDLTDLTFVEDDDEYDDVMDRIYDWANIHKIWIEEYT
jgi:hypothetical protein